MPYRRRGLLAVVLLFVLGAVPRAQDAFVGFASPVLFFLLGSTALGIGAEKTGLADRLATWLLRRSRGSGPRLLRDLLLTLPLQALLVPSAMSRNAVLVPVYDRVLVSLGRPPRLAAAVMLALGVLGPLASTALLSGGTSPVAAAEAIGGFTWFGWLIALAPVYYVLLAVGGVALWLMSPPEAVVEVDHAVMPPPGPFTGADLRVAAVMIATSVLWALDALTGWPPAIPALLALVALLAPRIGVMAWRDFAARAPWSTAVVLGAAISLADVLTRTGAASRVAGWLFGWIPSVSSATGAALAVFVVTCILALAIPNRAAAITLGVPLAAAYATTTPLGPAAAGLIVMIAVDAETIYPAQTAANLMAYERGHVGPGLLARFNLVTILAAAAIIVLVALPWWDVVGVPR